jgi:ubiquinone/menaquinone biosynthesis C-methylase UbiE
MRRWVLVAAGAAALTGIGVAVARSKGGADVGLRRSFEYALFGVPHGPLGRIGARMLAATKGSYYRAIAAQLDLQADDVLLDVGCGSAGLLVEQASHVSYVAGLDASELQVEMARRRLAARLAAGTAEIVLGDAAALPWEDGRFSVVASLDAMKFVPDPEAALREMGRVLRPGGRAVVTMSDAAKSPVGSTSRSGTLDAWGMWYWSDADARRMAEEAGFVDVTVSELPVISRPLTIRGLKPMRSAPGGAPASDAPVGSVVR